jgi:HK97 family phage prohead protease
MEIKRLQAGFQVKSLDDEGTFSGYGSVFDVEDLGGDIVARGAFTETLATHAKNGTMPALLWQHDSDKPIGVYTEMKEDSHGLYVEGQICLDSVLGKEAYALLKMGALSGLSIGYWPKKWEWDEDEWTRTLTEVELWETSMVTFPMNPSARIESVKALEDISTVRDAEHFLRESKGCSRSEAQGVIARVRTVLQREAEEKQAKATLQKLLASMKEN